MWHRATGHHLHSLAMMCPCLAISMHHCIGNIDMWRTHTIKIVLVIRANLALMVDNFLHDKRSLALLDVQKLQSSNCNHLRAIAVDIEKHCGWLLAVACKPDTKTILQTQMRRAPLTECSEIVGCQGHSRKIWRPVAHHHPEPIFWACELHADVEVNDNAKIDENSPSDEEGCIPWIFHDGEESDIDEEFESDKGKLLLGAKNNQSMAWGSQEPAPGGDPVPEPLHKSKRGSLKGPHWSQLLGPDSWSELFDCSGSPNKHFGARESRSPSPAKTFTKAFAQTNSLKQVMNKLGEKGKPAANSAVMLHILFETMWCKQTEWKAEKASCEFTFLHHRKRDGQIQGTKAADWWLWTSGLDKWRRSVWSHSDCGVGCIVRNHWWQRLRKGVMVNMSNAFIHLRMKKLKSHHQKDIVKVIGSVADKLVQDWSQKMGIMFDKRKWNESAPFVDSEAIGWNDGLLLAALQGNWEKIWSSRVSKLIDVMFVWPTKWNMASNVESHCMRMIWRSLTKTKKRWTNQKVWRQSCHKTQALKRQGPWSFRNDFEMFWEGSDETAHEGAPQKNVRMICAWWQWIDGQEESQCSSRRSFVWSQSKLQQGWKQQKGRRSFTQQWSRSNLQPAAPFLCTEVQVQCSDDDDDWKKKHLEQIVEEEQTMGADEGDVLLIRLCPDAVFVTSSCQRHWLPSTTGSVVACSHGSHCFFVAS